MKKIKLLILLITIGFFVLNQCNKLPYATPGEITGKKAKEKIVSAANQVDTIIISSISGISSAEKSLTITLDKILNDLVVPTLAKIDDGKMYTESSVDDCVTTITLVGLVIDSWIASVTCNVEEAGYIQINDTKFP